MRRGGSGLIQENSNKSLLVLRDHRLQIHTGPLGEVRVGAAHGGSLPASKGENFR